MYEFWYEHIKIRYGENEKLCYIDTDRFIVKCKKKDNIYKDVETRFDASNFEIDGPLPKAKNKKVIGLIKEELIGQIMKEFVAIRAKYVIKKQT